MLSEIQICEFREFRYLNMEKGRNYIKYEEIKKLLKLPEFRGIRVVDSRHATNSFVRTLPTAIQLEESQGDKITEAIVDDKSVASGDHSTILEDLSRTRPIGGEGITAKWSLADGSTKTESIADSASLALNVPDLLSGYDEYLRNFYYNNSCTSGALRINDQGTLSLNFGIMQVDVAINGAIRVVNAKCHIAMAINSDGSATAVMHPMGRVHHDGQSALLLAWDVKNNEHKHAKLLPDRCAFKSSDMSFSYVMDSAGTRTSMNQLPKVSMKDISLPVFYNTTPHGTQYKVEAETLAKAATQHVDGQGYTVWKIGNVIIKSCNGELRVSRPPSVHMRTSSQTGCLGISTDSLHCTATQGGQSHMFVRFGDNKMHTDGVNFKIRTQGQMAGFDEFNRITLF